MATWDDVRELVMGNEGVEEVTSRGSLAWRTKKRQVVWERPLRKTDLAELGDHAPDGPILGALVADEGEKFALVGSEPGFFTTHHFDGHRIVLIELDRIAPDRLAEVIDGAYAAATE